MKGKKMFLKAVSTLLALLLTLSLAACGSGGQQTGQTTLEATVGTQTESVQMTEGPKEPVTIRMLNPATGEAGWNDNVDSPVQQEIKKQTGITLEIVDADADKFNVLLAGGDLPDLVRVETKYYNQMIEGNNVIALDDLLQTNGKNILENIPDTLAFSKKNWSNEQNKVFFIPVQVQTVASNTGYNASMGPAIRWDYYKELGFPEIKNSDDLLKVIAQIVEKHPKTDEGKKVYGISMFTDWGLLWFTGMSTYSSHGTYGSYGLMNFNVDTGEYQSLFTSPNSSVWTGVDFFYKANKMGIFDPDGLTMKFGDYSAKEMAGQVVFTPATWCSDFTKQNAVNGKGFMVLPLEWGYQYTDATGANAMGWQKSFAITKSCKVPDRAMDLLNYLYSYDGCRTMYNGVKGIHWDDVDGKPTLKAETIKMRSEGGDAYKKSGIQEDFNVYGLAPVNIHPGDGKPLNLFNTEEVFSTMLNNLEKDFCSHYNITYPGQIYDKLVADGKAKNMIKVDQLAVAALEPRSDEIIKIEAKLTELVTNHVAKCILSKSDEELAANKQAAMADFKAAGMDTLEEFYVKAWATAKAKVAAK